MTAGRVPDRRGADGPGPGGPGFVAPMLAVPGALPADPTGWSAEVKWDGIRLVTAIAADGSVRCWTRAAREVGGSWPEVTRSGPVTARGGRGPGASGPGRRPAGRSARSTPSAVLDGEIVALDPAGRPSFARLQQRIHLTGAEDVRRAAARDPAVLMVFDVLALDGEDVTGRPWVERRALLDALAADGTRVGGTSLADRGWQVPAAHPDPAALFAFTAGQSLEGVVCKRRSSTYRPGVRSEDWVKVKHVRTQEVVVGGWLPGQGNRAGGLGALLVGIPEPTGASAGAGAGAAGPVVTPTARPLRYVGRVGTGFDAPARRLLLLDRCAPLTTTRSPFTDVPTRDARDATWVEPVLVGEVVFAEWTVNRRLRQPAWRGLRVDKDPAAVVEEA